MKVIYCSSNYLFTTERDRQCVQTVHVVLSGETVKSDIIIPRHY